MEERETYNFEAYGIKFYVIWKHPNSACLLRNIDYYNVHQICADLFLELHDGSSNFNLSKDEAFAKAPMVAKFVLEKQRIKEAQYMEQMFTDKDFREKYPVYKVFVINKVPVVWASHMGYIYIKKSNWRYIAWAKTQEETIKIVEEKISIQFQKEPCGIVDNNGNTILKPIYDNISIYKSDFSDSNNDNYAIVKKNNKFAYFCLKENKFLTEFIYHKAYPFNFYLARVITKNTNNDYTISFINNSGLANKGIEFNITNTEFLNIEKPYSYSNLEWSKDLFIDIKEMVIEESCKIKIFDQERTLYFPKPNIIVISYMSIFFYELDKIEYQKERKFRDIYPLQMPIYRDVFWADDRKCIVLAYDETNSKLNNFYTYESIVVNPVIYNFLFDHLESDFLQELYKDNTDLFAEGQTSPIFNNKISFYLKMINVIGAYVGIGIAWKMEMIDWSEIKMYRGEDGLFESWYHDGDTTSPIIALFAYYTYFPGGSRVFRYHQKAIDLFERGERLIREIKEIPYIDKFPDMHSMDIRFFIVSYMIATIHDYIYVDDNKESNKEKDDIVNNFVKVYSNNILSANKLLNNYFDSLVQKWKIKIYI